MNNIRTYILIFLLLFCSLVFMSAVSCHRLEYPTGDFEILRIDINPEDLYVNMDAILTAQVNNPSNEELRYKWEVSGGVVYGSGYRVQWHTPGMSGSYIIELGVIGQSGEDYERRVVDIKEMP
ncbi:MAG: hypothetical protein ACUVWP_03885 [bacterium]